MESKIKLLLEDLKNDEDYKEYTRIYEKESYVNKELLSTLLNTHSDFYYAFLKVNILLYRYDTTFLRKDLQDYRHYKGDSWFMDDLDIILDYYFSNYLRCRTAIQKIITYKLRPSSERKILQMIYERKPLEEIKPLPKNDES